ncbi:MAG: AAA family ATPase [Waddliaceae bacterium]|jgi:DNA repair ATPase RecN|nr:AAA family ATPase [Waddliaceae bacterium]MBT3579403.1 AAA family ATPase [Waddliaceae bacterium]MBT4444623.1 AAA family ATPase [Waddliaceae bacterium]MBT6928753.1 AAA family ATPase [Waddliaceae bacterium]MBT7264221.1 AAA family ATPase [Waddliaceae bacterium]
MIQSITLKNYMSHKETSLDLAKGLTVLVGPNNCGKSAVVSAIQSLCYNSSGSYMVRHGEKEASVTVDTSEGDTITWRRKGAAVSYNINEKRFDRCRGDVPAGLHDILRLPQVSSEKRDFDIHFGKQKTPLFLIDEPGSKAASFFASSSDAYKLLEMQNNHRDNVRDARRDERRLYSDVEALNTTIALLEPIDPIDDDIESIEKEYDTITTEERAIAMLKDEITSLEESYGIAAYRKDIDNTLEYLKTMPAFEDEEGTQALIEEMSLINNKTLYNDALKAILATTKPPQQLQDSNTVEDEISALMTVKESLRHCRAIAEDCDAKIGESKESIQQWVKDNPQCPTCGAETDITTVIHGGCHG